jgi:hypothetical protein
MFLGLDGIHAFATGFLTGGILLGERARSHGSNLQEFGFHFFNLGLDLFPAHSVIVYSSP